MMTSFLALFVGGLLYGELTLGKLIVYSYFMIAIRLGISHEERELRKAAGKSFEIYCDFIPNLVIPDLSVYFKSSVEY